MSMYVTACIFVLACGTGSAQLLEDKEYWETVGRNELDEALAVKWNERLAKNVILFVGDGMDINTITASRIYKAGEKSKLVFEDFPHMGLLKTYCVDKQVPDSASTASALFAGVKINYNVIGVDANVKLRDCDASLNESYRFTSLLQWAQDAGKDTGFVTNTRITHATPAALFAHSADRSWECDGKMPTGTENCKDIARQLVEDLPGRNIKVIMGGGRQGLHKNFTVTKRDPVDNWGCRRKDDRNLTEYWMEDKRKRGFNHQVLSNNGDLRNLDTDSTEFVLGVFANGHLQYEYNRDKSDKGMPSLKEMTAKAIEILQKSKNGYVLVVEGGLIDQAHHRGTAKKALNETVAFEEAIAEALRLSDIHDRARKNTFIHQDVKPNTLIVVTSDHGHSMTINGFPNRGNDIAGIAQNSTEDGVPYTTLQYTTADSLGFNYSASKDGKKVVRASPLDYNYKSFDYHQQAGVHTNEGYHGGGDVAVYAKGPMAHLFHSVHEQNYVAHVIAYAAKIGPYSRHKNAATSIHVKYTLLFVPLLIVFKTIY